MFSSKTELSGWRWLSHLALGCALFFAQPLAQADAQDSVDLVYVAVGSRHYATVEAKDTSELLDIQAASRSAARVSDILARRGASDGFLLTSASGAFVTRDDALGAVDAGIAAARRHERPFLLVYFAGHGLSEGFAWTHISIPGNLVIGLDENGKPELDLDTAAAKAIVAGELVDRLNASGLDYVLILDTCYEGDAVALDAYQAVLSAQLRTNLADMAAILRFMNQFHQEDPVVFSTQPGTLVSTVADPRDDRLSLAPMGRRFDLLSNRQDEVTLNDLLAALTGPGGDPLTRPGETFAERDNAPDRVLFREDTGNTTTPTQLKATGTQADVCCRASDAPMPAPAVPTHRARLTIQGPQGEFVTDGRKHTVEVEDIEFETGEASALSVVFWPESGEVWSSDFWVGDRQVFEAGKRYTDDEAGPAGLSVSGDGRGCSQETGYFEVHELVYDAEGLKYLKLGFAQSCDGNPLVARGELVISRL